MIWQTILVIGYVLLGIAVALLKYRREDEPRWAYSLITATFWPVCVLVEWSVAAIADRGLDGAPWNPGGKWIAIRTERGWGVVWSSLSSGYQFQAAAYDNGTASAESFAVAHADKLNREGKRPDDFVQ